ncbi:MAG TPA: M48 family metalloprotease [Pyrinomonadaceae bacterium]|nr:M48 family metalloprotease [Pyrinomonadaceae bacterium]
MYYLLGASLAFAALFAVNLLSSLTATAYWLCARRGAHRWSARARARLVFALRFIPLVVSVLVTFTLVVPAYVVHEPPASGEVPSIKLAVVALLSACGICFSAWRAVASWRATRRLTSLWMRQGVPVGVAGNSIPAYRIAHPFPLVAVVGAFKPRLFIANQVFETLDEDEIAAAVAHETAHVAAHDNLKRTLLNFCRDVMLTIPCARTLDDAWSVESEAAADERAASAGAFSALTLAGALVKIARMAPAGMKPFMPVGSYIAGDAGCVERRVRLLTRIASSGSSNSPERLIAPRFLKVSLAGTLGAFLFAAALPDVLATAHALLEFFVRL